MTVSTIAAGTIPAPASADLLGAIETLSTTNRLIGMSRDRTTLYARSVGTSPADRTLRTSTDDGTTWADVYTFPYSLEGMVELDDGEALVVCQGGSASPGYVYRSTGWATDRATATWARTLTTTSGYIRSVWGMHQSSHAGPVVMASEYGSQTTASGDQTFAATRAYLSEDSGRTWRTVLDLVAMFPGLAGIHVHASAYDAAWDRLWVTYGDVTSHLPATSAQVMYSDDRGETWTHVTKPAAWTGAGGWQPTTIAVTDRAIFTLPDGVPFGVVTQVRRGYRNADPAQLGPTWAGNTGSQGIGYCLSRAYGTGDRPLLGTTQGGANGYAPALLLADPTGTGQRFVELFRDLTSNTSTVHFAAGPTALGNIVFALGGTMRRAKWKSSPSTGGGGTGSGSAATGLMSQLRVSDGQIVDDTGRVQPLVGENIYWLGLNDNGSGGGANPEYPTKAQITAALEAAKARGCTLVRAHTIGISAGKPKSFMTGPDTFVDANLDAADWAVAELNRLEIRLATSFTDKHRYYHGGRDVFTTWAGLPAQADNSTAFWSDATSQALYLKYLDRRLKHVNPYTGRTLGAEPCYLLGELTNEDWTLVDNELREPFATQTNAALDVLANLAPGKLRKITAATANPGNGAGQPLPWTAARRSPMPGLGNPRVDVVGGHYYVETGPPSWTKGAMMLYRDVLERDVARVTSTAQAFHIGEQPYTRSDMADWYDLLLSMPRVNGFLTWSRIVPGQEHGDFQKDASGNPVLDGSGKRVYVAGGDDVAIYEPPSGPGEPFLADLYGAMADLRARVPA